MPTETYPRTTHTTRIETKKKSRQLSVVPCVKSKRPMTNKESKPLCAIAIKLFYTEIKFIESNCCICNCCNCYAFEKNILSFQLFN